MSDDLTAAEQRVLDAFRRDEVADFTEVAPEDARLRASFLRSALAARAPDGPTQDWPELRGALRIRGAHIEGLLRAPIGDGVLASGRAALWFRDCVFDAPVDLSGAELLSLRMIECSLPALIGASLSTRADLDLSGSRLSGIPDHAADLDDVGACAVYLSGARIGGRLRMGGHRGRCFEAGATVRLEGARIEGDLILEGARLDGGEEPALDARTASVGGDARLTPHVGASFEARGEVSFSAASIAGDLLLGGAWLRNPQGRALHCEDLQVETVSLSARGEVPFRAVGRLNFLSATVGGNFLFSRARVAPGPDYQGRIARGGPVCINLQQMRVSNALILTQVGALDPEDPDRSAKGPHRPVSGWFLLSGAELNSIVDEESGWPEAGFLELEGLTYKRISESDGGDQTARRMRWLRLQYPGGRPSAATFRPQPYEVLALVLRQHGRRDEADAIAVEKVRMRLASRVDGPWARLLPRVLMLVSLHGHSSARALLCFALFILLGTGLYGVALWGFQQPFLPVELDPEPVEYRAAFGLLRTVHPAGCPALEVPFFALDAALPLVDIGQTSVCRFAPRDAWRSLWLLLHSLYTLLGAALSAIVVLTLSGLLRRD